MIFTKEQTTAILSAWASMEEVMPVQEFQSSVITDDAIVTFVYTKRLRMLGPPIVIAATPRVPPYTHIPVESYEGKAEFIAAYGVLS